MSIVASLLVLIGANGAVATEPAVLVEPDPKSMTQKQIREFNAKLSRNHPFYIRCVRSDETGSIARKNFSCRTNRQWDLADSTGNQNARDTVDAMASKFWNTN